MPRGGGAGRAPREASPQAAGLTAPQMQNSVAPETKSVAIIGRDRCVALIAREELKHAAIIPVILEAGECRDAHKCYPHQYMTIDKFPQISRAFGFRGLLLRAASHGG